MHWLRLKVWPPYVVGAMIGVLSWFTFVSADKPLGVSTAFVRTTAMVENAVSPAHVQENAYFQIVKPVVDWQLMVVVGVFIGAYASASLSSDRETDCVPQIWRHRFGDRPWLRFVGAFAGGFLLLFGARLAGGCTSGHGISGSLQLAVSGWTFFGAVFVAGVATAMPLFWRERKYV